jgi:zinc protease
MGWAQVTVAVTILGVMAATASAEGSRPRGIPRAERVELPNGMRLIVISQRHLPMVVVNATVDAGSRFDPNGLEGLAGLTAELLAEGTEKRSAAEIHETVDSLGARLSAAAGGDYATVSLTILRQDLPRGVELLAEILKQPAFREEDFARKRDEALAEIEAEDQNPSSVADREFRKALFGSGPYRAAAGGWRESVARISREDVRSFYRRAYGPERTVLVAAGDVGLEELRQLVSAHFANWRRADEPPEQPVPVAPSGPSLVRVDRDLSQANLVWGHGGTTRDDPDWYALQVMNYILGGGGFSSRLMNSIRVEGGLAYSVFSYFTPGKLPGSFQVALQTKSASTAEAIERLEKEIERIRTEPVTEEELAGAKKFLTGSFPLKFDSNGDLAVFFSQVEFYGLGLDYPERYPRLIESVTRDDVLRVAKKYLKPEERILVVVGKQSEIQLPGAP